LSYITLGGSTLTLLILLVVFAVALLFVAGLHTHDKLSTSIEIDAPAKDVWDALVDFDQYGEWNPFLTNVDGNAKEGEKIKVTVALPFKQSMDFNLKVKTIVNRREMIWLGQTLEPRILDGEHYFRVESIGKNRTRFSQGEKFSGILLYLTWPLLKGSVLANFNTMNSALKDKVEGVEKIAEQSAQLESGAA